MMKKKLRISGFDMCWLCVMLLSGLCVLVSDTNDQLKLINGGLSVAFGYVVLGVLILTLIGTIVRYRKTCVPLLTVILMIVVCVIQPVIYGIFEHNGLHEDDAPWEWVGLLSGLYVVYVLPVFIGLFLLISLILFMIDRKRSKD